MSDNISSKRKIEQPRLLKQQLFKKLKLCREMANSELDKKKKELDNIQLYEK
jgi:hypothetical protein